MFAIIFAVVIMFRDPGYRQNWYRSRSTVNFDKLLDSSELQFSHLSSGNDNAYSITSPHMTGLPSTLLLNHAKLMLLICVKRISYLVIIIIIVNYLGILPFRAFYFFFNIFPLFSQFHPIKKPFQASSGTCGMPQGSLHVLLLVSPRCFSPASLALLKPLPPTLELLCCTANSA